MPSWWRCARPTARCASSSGDHLTSEGLAQVLADLEAEGVRLLAARRSAGLVYDALQGKRYVPRL